MFIKILDRHINLDTVISVKMDYAKQRIAFNNNYLIVKNEIIRPDVLFIGMDDETLNKHREIFKNVKGFIEYEENKFLNIKNVTNIKYIEEEQKIIFNFGVPHTYLIEGNERVLAEFVYMLNVSRKRYEEIVNSLEHIVI